MFSAVIAANNVFLQNNYVLCKLHTTEIHFLKKTFKLTYTYEHYM